MTGFTAEAMHHADHGLIRALTIAPTNVSTPAIDDIRQAAARLIGNRTFPTFADAWNTITGASPGRPGGIMVQTRVRCTACGGHKISRRTGTVCLTCQARGTCLERVNFIALWRDPAHDEGGRA